MTFVFPKNKEELIKDYVSKNGKEVVVDKIISWARRDNMPSCGSQCILCDLPIRFDNYKGCTHGCRYCFTQRKNKNLNKVDSHEGVQALSNFINGKRNQDTNWCWKYYI